MHGSVGARQGFINRAAASRNSQTNGNNKGKPATYRVVHPDDRPDSAAPEKWDAAALRVQASTKSIKSRTTGRFTTAGNHSIPGDQVR